MSDVLLNSNQTFATPQAALAHHGVKGQKWGVRNDNRVGASSSASAELAPLAVVTAIFAGIVIAQARHEYVDSGKRDQKILNKAAKKSGKQHEWKKNAALAGPKTHDQLTKQVIPAINKGYPKVPGTSMNCRRCTFAYEMRRRGYDVKATKSHSATGQDSMGLSNATSPKGSNGSIRNAKRPQSAWGQNVIPTTVNGRPMTSQGKSKAIFDALGRQPDGSRGELAFSWGFGGGHSVAYEVVGGKPIVFDTQSGRSWATSEVFHSQMGAIVGDAAYTRLDNANLNNEFLKRWVADAD